MVLLDVYSVIKNAEYVIIISVILFQFFYSRRVLINVKVLKNIFSLPLKIKIGYIEKGMDVSYANMKYSLDFSEGSGVDKNDYRKISIIETESDNEVLIRIKEAVNNYLLNNYGASVNFSIIKDIIDREFEVKDDEINQSIPTPLYLGLAATMVGIIFGLFSMPDIGGESDSFTVGISALIDGVKIAMFASLSGLALTTFLSAFFYKRAKRVAVKEKNEQVSYLQAVLLPELMDAEESGISGLKHSLDQFSRDAINIADKMNNAAQVTSDSIESQLEVIEKVDKLKMSRVSKANLELFEKLDKSMESLQSFADYLSKMEEISNNLSSFAERTNNVEQIMQDIKSAMKESRDVSQFLSSHLKKIDQFGSHAIQAIDFADAHFNDAIEKLDKEMQLRISKMNESADNHEVLLKDVYNDIGQKLQEVTAKHVEELEVAYSDAVPKFKQLDHLSKLEPIKDSLEEKTDILKQGNDEAISLREKIDEVKILLEESKRIKNSSKNDELLNAIKQLANNKQGGGVIPSSENGNMGFVKDIELILRLVAWTAITSYGIHTVLIYFGLMN